MVLYYFDKASFLINQGSHKLPFQFNYYNDGLYTNNVSFANIFAQI